MARPSFDAIADAVARADDAGDASGYAARVQRTCRLSARRTTTQLVLSLPEAKSSCSEVAQKDLMLLLQHGAACRASVRQRDGVRVDIDEDGCRRRGKVPALAHQEQACFLRVILVCQRCLQSESSRNAVNANWGQRFGDI